MLPADVKAVSVDEELATAAIPVAAKPTATEGAKSIHREGAM